MTYATRDELRQWIGVSDNFTRDDAKLDDCLEAAGALIDAHCGRSFVATAAGAVASAKVFRSVYVDDFSTATDLVVQVSADRSTWTTLTIDADFWIGPDPTSAYDDAYWQINPMPTVCWPSWSFVKVTAKWGWPSTPTAVATATKLVAHWLARRSGDPYAVTSIGELPSRLSAGDPDVRRLLAPLVRVERVVGMA